MGKPLAIGVGLIAAVSLAAAADAKPLQRLKKRSEPRPAKAEPAPQAKPRVSPGLTTAEPPPPTASFGAAQPQQPSQGSYAPAKPPPAAAGAGPAAASTGAHPSPAPATGGAASPSALAVATPLPGAAPAPITPGQPPLVGPAAAPAIDGGGALQPAGRGGRRRQFGVMIDVGVPDGMMASLAYRPHEMVRLRAGLGTNGVSTGLRVGGTFLPLGWGPTASLEAGRYFEGDANGMAARLAGDSDSDSEVLERIGYTFVNARLGWEVGRERWVFFVRGGLSYLRMRLHELDTLVEEGQDESAGTRVEIPESPLLKLRGPSFQMGMLWRL